ncbi:MAG: alpha/beta fold hydrolase [Anaeroplasmataceae bacterium]|nr:alpha/beta fold hydrolase [Anaeroplasmataceae bacterium]
MKALICLHGLLSTKADYREIAYALEDRYDTIACYDLPGHGYNTLKYNTQTIKGFLLDIYDSLAIKHDRIDVIGYSMGGVMACYLQSVRKVDKMVLLAPSYRYLNLKNYHIKKKERKQPNISSLLPKKNFLHVFRFTKIMYDLSDEFHMISPATLILWGKDDYLVKEESGFLLYQMITNRNRRFIELSDHNHFNIVRSPIVIKYICKFLDE